MEMPSIIDFLVGWRQSQDYAFKINHVTCSIAVSFYGGCEGKVVFLYIFVFQDED